MVKTSLTAYPLPAFVAVIPTTVLLSIVIEKRAPVPVPPV
jgi:hypothetical protein